MRKRSRDELEAGDVLSTLAAEHNIRAMYTVVERSFTNQYPQWKIKILMNWIMKHKHNPYPSRDEKKSIQDCTGLTVSQIENWMSNARRRTLKKKK